MQWIPYISWSLMHKLFSILRCLQLNTYLDLHGMSFTFTIWVQRSSFILLQFTRLEGPTEASTSRYTLQDRGSLYNPSPPLRFSSGRWWLPIAMSCHISWHNCLLFHVFLELLTGVAVFLIMKTVRNNMDCMDNCIEAQWGLYIKYMRETLDYNISIKPLTIIPLTPPQMQRRCIRRVHKTHI
jgi:hypothetical protein